MTIKVGDTLYLLHRDRRPREPKWTLHTIIGETKLSWLIGEGWAQEKINKKTMRTKMNWQGENVLYRTSQECTDYDFCEAWRKPLMVAIEQCREPERLKKIAEILGVEIA